ncbi:MAG TPA: glycerol-3-phosphate 1-O-acyltransferase PlsY [Longimicrobiaceae bacterium]
MIPALLALVSYLLGAIPTSYIAGRWTRGIDLRKHGSGNLGATNTFRVLGARVAAPVMVVDVAKGFLPTLLFPRWDGTPEWSWVLAYGAAAVLGHVFPVYMRFRGGKGVATGAGVFLAIAPRAVLPAVVAWLVVLKLSRMVSLASITAAVTLIAGLLVTEDRLPVLLTGVAISLFVIYAHRSNIRRIMRGEEHRFGGGRARPEPEPRREES